MSDADAISGPDTHVDEHRIAKGVALGLPLVTISVAAVVGILVGPATSILVLAAGLLLGVIAILWASLRILSGDAPLSPELEALDMAAQGVDALASRKKMLFRQLKDLDNERAIGKIDPEDYEQISATYRDELKAVLRRIDESLAPHRARAEKAAHAHLVSAGVVDADDPGAQRKQTGSAKGDAAVAKDEAPVAKAEHTPSKKTTQAAPWRVACPSCNAANERDAKFCKECAAKLTADAKRVSIASIKVAVPAEGLPDADDDDNDDEDSNDDD